MLVILDSNILLSALISPFGPPHRIYQAWRRGQFELVTCTDQIEELRRASQYAKFRTLLHPHLVGLMLNNLQRAQILDRLPPKHSADDPDDSYLLNLAEASQAHYLVTGDKHAGLLKMRRIGKTRIFTASAFCERVLRKK
jgi:hypothetical protein